MNKVVTIKKSMVRLALAACLTGLTAPFLCAQDLYLLQSESPSFLGHNDVGFSPTLSYETGAIPTSLIKPEIAYVFRDAFQATASVDGVYFYGPEDFILAAWKGTLKYRHPFFRDAPFKVYPYVSLDHTFADPYIVPYTGTLPSVYAVMSPYTDKGLDLIGGLTGFIPFTYKKNDVGLLLTAEYSRGFFRDYNPVFAQEEYRNRLFFNIAPAVFYDAGEKIPFKLAVYAQNQFTYWYARGFMYDFMPQATVTFNESLSCAVGVTIPFTGARVSKVYIAPRVVLNTRETVRIVNRDIFFPPNKAILFGPENEKSESNERILDALYGQLAKYPEYRIVVEGHTSFVNWNDPVKGPLERKNELLPLSKARATAVVNALIERGISPARISAVGKGADEPVVAFKKLDKQWKNRRVEIRLYRDKKK